jgi:hypothetical protein
MTGYTPVPTVAANDWIDEIFINTYWGDNMAASVPDVFSAKGQLPVGSGVDEMGVLNVDSNGKVLTADSTQPLGVTWKEILIVANRQGGSPTIWNSQGTANYIPENSRLQVGAGRVPFVASAVGNVTITFPVLFANVPIVMVTSRAIPIANGLKRFYVGNESASAFTLFVELDSSTTNNLDFNWMAIGPTS